MSLLTEDGIPQRDPEWSCSLTEVPVLTARGELGFRADFPVTDSLTCCKDDRSIELSDQCIAGNGLRNVEVGSVGRDDGLKATLSGPQYVCNAQLGGSEHSPWHNQDGDGSTGLHFVQ
jgi:hypothetical protein